MLGRRCFTTVTRLLHAREHCVAHICRSYDTADMPYEQNEESWPSMASSLKHFLPRTYGLVLRDVDLRHLASNQVDHPLSDVGRPVSETLKVMRGPQQICGSLDLLGVLNHECQ